MRKKFFAIILAITMLIGVVFILPACDFDLSARFTLTVEGGYIFVSQAQMEKWEWVDCWDEHPLNWNSPPVTKSLRRGQQVFIYNVTHGAGFNTFTEWLDGDEKVSTERDFIFSMPNRNVVLTQRWTDLGLDDYCNDCRVYGCQICNNIGTPSLEQNIPFSQKINSNFAGNYGWNKLVQPSYTSTNIISFVSYDAFDLPIRNTIEQSVGMGWWLYPHRYAMEIYNDYLYFTIVFTHPNTGIRAWLSNIKIYNNTIIFHANRFVFDGGGRAITHVNITARINKFYVQNITDYVMMVGDVEYAPQSPPQPPEPIEFESTYTRVNGLWISQGLYDIHLFRSADAWWSFKFRYHQGPIMLGPIDPALEDFFEDNQLILVRVLENSSSIRHSVTYISENGMVFIDRIILAVSDYEMAEWTILIKLCNTINFEQEISVQFGHYFLELMD